MSAASDLTARSRSIVTEAASKLSPIEYLKATVGTLSREDVDALAIAYLYGQVKNRARSVVLVAERGAERGAERTPERTTPPEHLAEFERQKRAREIENERRDRQITNELWASMNSAAEKYKERLRMDWTEELLGSEFALGDGTRVRWGDATAEQHRYRYELHKRNALAGLEGAARHHQAIERLEATGSRTLYDSMTKTITT